MSSFFYHAVVILVAIFSLGFRIYIYKCILAFKRQAYNDLKKGILKSGKKQEEQVVNYVLNELPSKLKNRFVEEVIRKYVQLLYRKAKDMVDDNKLNGSV